MTKEYAGVAAAGRERADERPEQRPGAVGFGDADGDGRLDVPSRPYTYFADATSGVSFGYGGASNVNCQSVAYTLWALPYNGVTGMASTTGGSGTQQLKVGDLYIFEVVIF